MRLNIRGIFANSFLIFGTSFLLLLGSFLSAQPTHAQPACVPTLNLEPHVINHNAVDKSIVTKITYSGNSCADAVCEIASNETPKQLEKIIVINSGEEESFNHIFSTPSTNDGNITVSIECPTGHSSGSSVSKTIPIPILTPEETTAVLIHPARATGSCYVILNSEQIGDSIRLNWTVGPTPLTCASHMAGGVKNGGTYFCQASSSDGSWSGPKALTPLELQNWETLPFPSDSVTYTLACHNGRKGVTTVNTTSLEVEISASNPNPVPGEEIVVNISASKDAVCSVSSSESLEGIPADEFISDGSDRNPKVTVLTEGNIDLEITCTDPLTGEVATSATSVAVIDPGTIPGDDDDGDSGDIEPEDAGEIETTVPEGEAGEDHTEIEGGLGGVQRDIFVDGLVPCGRGEFWPDGSSKPDCTFCHGIILINNLIKFMLIIAFLAGGVILVAAGILLLISGVNPGLRTKGKQMATATAIGLIIMVLSWVIVSTIINVLAQDNEAVKANFNLTNGSFQINCKSYNTGSDIEGA